MSVVSGGISVNDDKTMNFGNYKEAKKIKVQDFEFFGDLYSVKTHNEVTRLEQNGKLLVECVPGASFFNFALSEEEITCIAYGKGVTNITLELSPETSYRFVVDGVGIGSMKSTISGKINFSAEFSESGTPIRIAKE